MQRCSRGTTTALKAAFERNNKGHRDPFAVYTIQANALIYQPNKSDG